jgi:hypothetical protein
LLFDDRLSRSLCGLPILRPRCADSSTKSGILEKSCNNAIDLLVAVDRCEMMDLYNVDADLLVPPDLPEMGDAGVLQVASSGISESSP